MLNKVTLMGRLTKDPMVKYSQGGTAIARYTLAIDRRPGKNGEQVTDFIDCIAFGSSGKFVEKYLRKGRKIVACGKLELNSYTKDDGTKVYALDVVMNEHYFADEWRTRVLEMARRPWIMDLGCSRSCWHTN